MHWSRVDDVLAGTGDLDGRIGLNCCVPLDQGNSALVVGTTTSGAEGLARRLPRARLVATFNYSKPGGPRLVYRFDRMSSG